MNLYWSLIVTTLGVGPLLVGCTLSARVGHIRPEALPNEWRTHAERTAYAETGRYAETVDFCRRLAAASPAAHYATFGVSGEGRALPLLVLSTERAFTPEAARHSRRPLVLVQNCIHAGECEGKDACLELARDMLVCGAHSDLLRDVNLLVLPIFNVDGHERFGPYNRINQNGPREMGWRTTAVNLNLNRDYVKADAVEMQAWLRLWNAWQPDLFIDNHTTDGHNDQYDLYYLVAADQEVAAPISAWVHEVLLASVLPALEADGYLALPYAFPRDSELPSKGIVAVGPMSPRMSTSYVTACNRVGILVETHSTVPYGRRVRATYDFLRRTLETVSREPEQLRLAIRRADADAVQARGGGEDGRVPLAFEPTGDSVPLLYRGVEVHKRPSEITGTDVLEYTKTPADVQTELLTGWRASLSVLPPAAYLIPPQWTEAIGRLELHGVRLFRLPAPETLDIESYRFEEAAFSDTPYEGRQMARYKAVPLRERRDFPAGTVVVPMAQPRARLAVHLLEPEAADSLAAWGYFNAVFERKEYFEAHVMEPIAAEMLAADPALRKEFEGRLAADEEFARNPRQRLQFFYQRSPYWDAAYCVYAVARLADDAVLRRLCGDGR